MVQFGDHLHVGIILCRSIFFFGKFRTSLSTFFCTIFIHVKFDGE